MSPPPVYLDHAATTPVRAEVLEAMLPFLGPAAFGNPASAHGFGRTARAGVEEARRKVAAAVGAEPSQVIFTSGGTEADNLAVVGASLAAGSAGRPMHAAVCSTDHKAVLAAAHAVVRLGGSESILPVDGRGILDLAELDRVLETQPAVVSVMWVNNEVGTIQPVEEIGRRCRAAGTMFHTDAVQAFGQLPVSLEAVDATLLTLSGHKIGAPKGIGALVVRSRAAIESIIHGGSQQFGLRPGTENVAGSVALGRAAELAAKEQGAKATRLGALRDDLAGRIRSAIPDAVWIAEDGPRAPHVLSMAIPGADAEALLMHLDLQGIAASGGSACNTGAAEPSHVLTAMGVPREWALCTVRFSLGRETVPADIDRAAEVFPGVVAKVRKLAGVLGRA
jgi:cysteine desulfurase